MSIRLLARMLAGIGLCAAAFAASATGPYSNLVVFGDSLSDSGNNAILLTQALGGLPPVDIQGDGYYSKIPSVAGTYSNGAVWTQYFAQSLGLPLAPSLAGGTNFAFGGAQTGIDGTETPQGFPFSMKTQLGMYFNATHGAADPNALYVVAGGGNNIREALEAIGRGADPNATAAATVAGYAADMAGIVGNLKLAGAQHVLVLNTPNFGLTPLANAMGVSTQASGLSFAMDAVLNGALAGSGATVFDMYGFMTNAVNNAAQLGFSNWTNACAANGSSCDVSTSLFWDGIHPTTAAHQQLAAAVFAVAVPEPDTVALLAAGLVVVALARSRARRRAGLQQG
ncbi:SGNH/GDSL hydrolase family protein [Roseateles sp. NT4]|uniref:SGNH/GDSL hydrolase family protein n=1 Tax=Roseateles sp. NT4 TaxID=3453715 RepID=UPI003EEA45BA